MTVLVLVAPGSEEIETVAIVDTLVRARIEVLLASCCPAGLRQIRASRGVQLVADYHIDELTSRDFEVIVVPGGLPGSEAIRDTPLAIDLLREQAALGRWRAAICAAPQWCCNTTICWGMPASPVIRAFKQACPPHT